MKRAVTTYIGRERYDWCEERVAEGAWSNRSELITHAMRLFLDCIHRDGITSVQHMVRGDTVRVSLRVDDYVVDGLMDTCMFARNEIADYAVAFYMKWLDNGDAPGGA